MSKLGKKKSQKDAKQKQMTQQLAALSRRQAAGAKKKWLNHKTCGI